MSRQDKRKSASRATGEACRSNGQFDFRQVKGNSEQVREADGGIKPGVSEPRGNEANEFSSPRSGRWPTGQMYCRIRSRSQGWCHPDFLKAAVRSADLTFSSGLVPGVRCSHPGLYAAVRSADLFGVSQNFAGHLLSKLTHYQRLARAPLRPDYLLVGLLR
jgi:hypothetical protein